jgi:hypothetical protein
MSRVSILSPIKTGEREEQFLDAYRDVAMTERAPGVKMLVLQPKRSRKRGTRERRPVLIQCRTRAGLLLISLPRTLRR